MRILRLPAVFIALVLATGTVFAADKFEAVKTQELAEAPQRYWATGIFFTDTLKSKPGDDTVHIGDEKYYRFKTAVVGDVYAEKKVLSVLRELKSGKEYGFAGTVLQKGRKYYIIVQTLSIVASGVEDLPRSLGDLVRLSTNAATAATFKRYETLLRGVQTDLLAYSREKNVDVTALFDPLSEHHEVPAQVMRSGVTSMADQMKTSPTDLLVDLLVAILARENAISAETTAATAQPPVKTAPPAPAPEAAPIPTQPEPIPELAPPPAEMEPEVPPVTQSESAPVAPAPVEFGDEEPPMLDESVIETFPSAGSAPAPQMPVIVDEGSTDESTGELILEPLVAPAPASEPAAEPAPEAEVEPEAAPEEPLVTPEETQAVPEVEFESGQDFMADPAPVPEPEADVPYDSDPVDAEESEAAPASEEIIAIEPEPAPVSEPATEPDSEPADVEPEPAELPVEPEVAPAEAATSAPPAKIDASAPVSMH
jgi:hypothetical protein